MLKEPCENLVYAPRSHVYCSAYAHQLVGIWSGSLTLLSTFYAGSKVLLDLAYSLGQNELVTSAKDGLLKVWNLRMGKDPDGEPVFSGADTRLSVEIAARWFTAMTIDDENQRIFGVDSGDVVIIHYKTGEVISRLRPFGEEATCVNYVTRNEVGLMFTGGVDGVTKAWASVDICMQSYAGSHSPVTCLLHLPATRCPATGCADGSVRVWDIESGTLLDSLVVYNFLPESGPLPFPLRGMLLAPRAYSHQTISDAVVTLGGSDIVVLTMSEMPSPYLHEPGREILQVARVKMEAPEGTSYAGQLVLLCADNTVRILDAESGQFFVSIKYGDQLRKVVRADATSSVPQIIREARREALRVLKTALAINFQLRQWAREDAADLRAATAAKEQSDKNPFAKQTEMATTFQFHQPTNRLCIGFSDGHVRLVQPPKLNREVGESDSEGDDDMDFKPTDGVPRRVTTVTIFEGPWARCHTCNQMCLDFNTDIKLFEEEEAGQVLNRIIEAAASSRTSMSQGDTESDHSQGARLAEEMRKVRFDPPDQKSDDSDMFDKLVPPPAPAPVRTAEDELNDILAQPEEDFMALVRQFSNSNVGLTHQKTVSSLGNTEKDAYEKERLSIEMRSNRRHFMVLLRTAPRSKTSPIVRALTARNYFPRVRLSDMPWYYIIAGYSDGTMCLWCTCCGKQLTQVQPAVPKSFQKTLHDRMGGIRNLIRGHTGVPKKAAPPQDLSVSMALDASLNASLFRQPAHEHTDPLLRETTPSHLLRRAVAAFTATIAEPKTSASPEPHNDSPEEDCSGEEKDVTDTSKTASEAIPKRGGTPEPTAKEWKEAGGWREETSVAARKERNRILRRRRGQRSRSPSPEPRGIDEEDPDADPNQLSIGKLTEKMMKGPKSRARRLSSRDFKHVRSKVGPMVLRSDARARAKAAQKEADRLAAQEAKRKEEKLEDPFEYGDDAKKAEQALHGPQKKAVVAVHRVPDAGLFLIVGETGRLVTFSEKTFAIADVTHCHVDDYYDALAISCTGFSGVAPHKAAETNCTLALGAEDGLIVITAITLKPLRAAVTAKYNHTTRVTSLWVCPFGTHCVSGSSDGSLAVWDTSGDGLLRSMQAGGPVAQLVPMDDGDDCLVAVQDSVTYLKAEPGMGCLSKGSRINATQPTKSSPLKAAGPVAGPTVWTKLRALLAKDEEDEAGELSLSRARSSAVLPTLRRDGTLAPPGESRPEAPPSSSPVAGRLMRALNVHPGSRVAEYPYEDKKLISPRERDQVLSQAPELLQVMMLGGLATDVAAAKRAHKQKDIVAHMKATAGEAPSAQGAASVLPDTPGMLQKKKLLKTWEGQNRRGSMAFTVEGDRSISEEMAAARVAAFFDRSQGAGSSPNLFGPPRPGSPLSSSSRESSLNDLSQSSPFPGTRTGASTPSPETSPATTARASPPPAGGVGGGGGGGLLPGLLRARVTGGGKRPSSPLAQGGSASPPATTTTTTATTATTTTTTTRPIETIAHTTKSPARPTTFPAPTPINTSRLTTSDPPVQSLLETLTRSQRETEEVMLAANGSLVQRAIAKRGRRRLSPLLRTSKALVEKTIDKLWEDEIV